MAIATIRGLRCPKCGKGNLRVTTTRPLPDGRVKRYHTCKDCGHHSTTFQGYQNGHKS